jgi:hypothetical protein
MGALGAAPGFVIGGDDLPSSPNALPGNEASSGCLGETRQAEGIGLDMFLMLDLSGSMLDPLPMQPAAATPTTKWDAVRGALESFVQAPETSEIGIGLQYFPQANPGVPFACQSSEDCGAGGSCTNSLCVTPARLDTTPAGSAWDFTRIAGETGTVCSIDADCSSTGGGCRTLPGACVFPAGAIAARPEGHFANVSETPETSFVSALCAADEDCQGVPGSRCEVVGLCSLAPVQCAPSAGCRPGAGECQPFPYSCSNYTSCDAARYASPAVDISSSEARTADAIASLRAQVPAGATPTGPALTGALQHARLRAEQHPERQVVTVLATDGFPTVCRPLEIPGIAELARAEAEGARPVRTFVIGVFGDLDADGQQRLDDIARAGGSDHALVVNTASSLADDFLAALNVVRSTAVSCEFQLDAEADLNFDRVNLRIRSDGDAATSLLNVGDASDCGDQAGWYYVRDAAGVPTQLSVCPATCAEIQGETARVDLEIGCATRIR